MRLFCTLACLGFLLSVSSAMAGDVTDGELAEEMRFHGGKNVFLYDWQVVTGDVTCDGNRDKLAGYVDLDNPDGPLFRLVVATREKGQLVSESVMSSFDSSDQGGFCGDGNPPPEIVVEQFTPEEIHELIGIEGACTNVILVVDGMCDSHHYFWVPDWEGDRKLVFFRH